FAAAGTGTPAPPTGRRGALEAMREDGERYPGLDLHTRGGLPPLHSAHIAYETTCVVVGLSDPVTWSLAGMGRRDGRRICSELQMAEDFANPLALRDDGDDPQHALLTPGAAGHIQRKDPLEQPRPAPARRRGARLWLVAALLPWRWDN